MEHSWEIEKQLAGVSARGSVFRGSNRQKGQFDGGFQRWGASKRKSRFPEDGGREVFPGRKPLSQVRGKQEGVGSEEVGKGGHTCPAHRPHEAGQVMFAEDRVWMEHGEQQM